jgi:hypothetical protein
VRRACRLLWLVASLTACSALAGCGGGTRAPALRADDAQRLIALSRQVETAKTACARRAAIARVRSAASQLIDDGRVPAALQETLSSGVNALVDDQPACLPSVSAPAETTTAAAATAPLPSPHPHPHPPKPKPKPKPHGHEPPHGPHGPHGHGHGHGGHR